MAYVFMVLLSVHFPDQRADRHRGAADAEQRRDVGDRADVLPDDVKAALLAKIPEAKLGEAQDIANVVAFLASDEAQYITGQTININGGMAMI